MRISIGFTLLIALLLATMPAAAQVQYPSRPVKIFVGVAPGGPSDFVGRIIAERLTERFKQPFVVENRVGANSLVAIRGLISSPPDGYTLLLAASGAQTISPWLEKNLPYNPLTSFSPIALAAAFPYILVVRRDLPVDDVKDLIEYSKTNPGKVSFGSAGNLSANHLGGEWLKGITGIDAQHIPYKGDSGALTDVIAGRVDFAFISAGTAMPQIKAGKVRGLAVTSPLPTKLAEGLPTMIESGVPGFAIEPWNGIVGPAGLPREIVVKLNQAINEELQRADVQARLAQNSLYSITDTPEGYRRRLEQELAAWRAIIKRANLSPE